ncbi:MAG: hypothetical protein RMK34_05725 [Tepidimonas sp.]|uniref:hypothetical protein n=1 Tax=Tepidimonas sp. TaxID=2002775 RepID=UPI00298EEDE2|nr:hypothetical protein [Tepidimonas sp.]MCS6810167.1 hypothetical protein [Tepidimonas sp.]MDW8336454.1 hypothetical protein [Tepidimonas sp.]
MDAPTALLHLLQLLAPAWAMAALLGARLAWRAPAGARWRRWGRETLWLAVPGSAVLVAGLVVSGADGRMATYAALVLVLGSLAAWRARRSA